MRAQTLEEVIERSKSMLDLPDNWDGEGSPGYDEATWQSAVDFVRRVVASVLIPHTFIPMITKGPDGSIDILWTYKSRDLLVNIPPDNACTFYGHDSVRKGTTEYSSVGGRIDLTTPNSWIVYWLHEAR